MASKLGASHLKQSRHGRLISSYEITQTVPIFYLVFPAAGFPFNYYDSIASKSIKSSSEIYMHKHKKNDNTAGMRLPGSIVQTKET